MKLKLKKLSQQVIVVTGATSGIGLVTARMAARRGAKLVLVARNEQALSELTTELTANGAKAVYAVADVADEAALQAAAQLAIRTFGGFDTWVNNAGVSVYGKLTDIPVADHRRLFETNFWGVVYGSRIAAEHLRQRGGALINQGSVLSDRAVSFQGMYSASKHAVKGFTDALRMELEQDNAPVAVTLIKPSGINTPFPEHARNYMPLEATLPPPVFAPELVAEAILHCAETPVRDFTVGESKMLGAMGQLAPRLTDKIMEKDMAHRQFKQKPEPHKQTDSLYATTSNLVERGDYEGHVFEESLQVRAKMHPIATGAVLLGAAVAVAAWLNRDKLTNGNGGQATIEPNAVGD
jgi:short-subunit dehydrogenase